MFAFLLLSGGKAIPLRAVCGDPPCPPGHDPIAVQGVVRLPLEAAGLSSAFLLEDRAGRPLPADLRILKGTPGFPGWLVFRAVAIPVRIQGKEGLRIRMGSARAAGRKKGTRCMCTKDGTGVSVDTGPLQVRCAVDSPGLVETFRVRGTPFFSRERSWSVEVRIEGERYRSRTPRTVLLRKGEASARVIVMGPTRSERNGPGPSYRMELRFLAGSARVEGRLFVEGGRDPLSGAGVVLHFHPLLERESGGLLFRGDRPDAYLRTARGGEARLVSTCRGGVVRVEGKSTVLEAGRTAGLRISDRRKGLWIWLPGFIPLHPWSLRYAPPADLSLCLFTDSFLWEPGIPLCRRFVLEPFKGRGSDRPPREEGIFVLPADPCLRAPPFLDLEPYDLQDPLHGLYLETTARLRAGLDEERRVWNGYRDWGDYRTRDGKYANNEYDPAYGLLKRFLLAGDPADLREARCMLEHHLLFDRTGPADAPLPPGLPFGHGEDHRSGWIETGHMWVDGTLLAWLLSGETRFLTSSMSVGKYLASRTAERETTARERCAAWTLVALTSLVNAGFSEFTDPMNEIAECLRAHQAMEGCFLFERKKMEDRSLFAVNTWVTAGITMEGLYRHYRVTGDPRSAAALVRCAKWIRCRCRDRKEGGWYRNLYYEEAGKGRGPPVLCRGHVVRENLAFLALGLARAAEVGHDAVMEETARRTLKVALERLCARPPAFPGRALSVTARSAPDVIYSCGIARGEAAKGGGRVRKGGLRFSGYPR